MSISCRWSLQCIRWIRHDRQRFLSLCQQIRRASTLPKGDDISPTLLTRARSISAQHATLSKQLDQGYDATISRRVTELSTTSHHLKEYDDAVHNYDNLLSMYGEDKEVDAMIDEERGDAESARVQAAQALKQSLAPVHPFAHLPCLMEIRPGAGGDEASIFAGDLLRMYQAFCARHGYQVTLMKHETADGVVNASSSSVQLTEAILEIHEPGSYGRLRCEAGVHRVQRVPLTETKGRTHTSAVSVLILPSIPTNDDSLKDSFDDPKSDYYVNSSDVRVDVMRAQGAGGQHVNKTESAVRLTHIPTNTVVAVQENRSQLKNREMAWNILRSRLAQQRREERDAEVVAMRRGAGAGKIGRENKIRTYNWQQQRVTDHRCGFESRRLDAVMEGSEPLDDVMESVRSWMADEEVLAIEAEDLAKA